MNWNLPSNDFFNTRGWGSSQATRWRYKTKQRRCPLRGEANEVRNFAARGCWAWWRVTAFKKQLSRIMLIFSGWGKAWVVNGGMRENRPGRYILLLSILLLSPAWSPQTFALTPHNFLEASEGRKSWNSACARNNKDHAPWKRQSWGDAIEVCKIKNDVEKVIQNELLILSHYTGTGKLPAEMGHRCKTNKRKHFPTQDTYRKICGIHCHEILQGINGFRMGLDKFMKDMHICGYKTQSCGCKFSFRNWKVMMYYSSR